MRELLDCLLDWAARNRADGSAYSLLVALVRETAKRAGSEDPAQREFDAEGLAPAAGGPAEFESAKRWIDRAKFELFAEARQTAIEEHFRAAGHVQALRVMRRSPRGKHRAVWYLDAYPLERAQDLTDLIVQAPLDSMVEPSSIQYDFTPPGKVRTAWYARPWVGSGSFITRSWRGLIWAALFLFPLAYLAFNSLVGLAYIYARRPLQTADLASMLAIAALSWFVWKFWIRPFVWLIDDRIIPVDEAWVAWKEAGAQLELATDANNRRRLQLVRYSAVCPICAGTIELRYSQGPNQRRLLGCCSEAPHEHVFSFDRISRRGSRLPVEQQ